MSLQAPSTRMANIAGSLQGGGGRAYSGWTPHAVTRPIASGFRPVVTGWPVRLITEENKENAMFCSLTIVCHHLSGRRSRRLAIASAVLAAACVATAPNAHGQMVVYETLRPVASYYTPVAAGYPGGYIANYSPAGNYAAVTAFSPPVATGYVANYPVANYPVANYQVANYQVANYAVESVASPMMAAPIAVTSYYSPAPVMAAPVMAYYAPTAVAVPLYRRGLFGGLRPTRTAMYIPY